MITKRMQLCNGWQTHLSSFDCTTKATLQDNLALHLAIDVDMCNVHAGMLSMLGITLIIARRTKLRLE